MRKVNKHYRLGYHTCDKLDILKNLMVGKTETAIVHYLESTAAQHSEKIRILHTDLGAEA